MIYSSVFLLSLFSSLSHLSLFIFLSFVHDFLFPLLSCICLLLFLLPPSLHFLIFLLPLYFFKFFSSSKHLVSFFFLAFISFIFSAINGFINAYNTRPHYRLMANRSLLSQPTDQQPVVRLRVR